MHQKLSNYETRPRQRDGPARHLNGIIAKSSKNSKKIPARQCRRGLWAMEAPRGTTSLKPLIVT